MRGLYLKSGRLAFLLQAFLSSTKASFPSHLLCATILPLLGPRHGTDRRSQLKCRCLGSSASRVDGRERLSR